MLHSGLVWIFGFRFDSFACVIWVYVIRFGVGLAIDLWFGNWFGGEFLRFVCWCVGLGLIVL